MNESFGVTIYAKPSGRLERWRARFGRSRPVAVPRGYSPPSARRTKVPLVRFRHTLWLFVLGGGYLGTVIYGTPHMLTTYTYWGPEGSTSYSTCNYWGLDSQTVSVDGACPYFRLLKAQEARHG